MTAFTPFAPGAIRDFLIGHDEFTTFVAAENISTRDLPDPILAPFVVLSAPSNYGEDPMLRRPMIQADVWVPKLEILGGDVDPEELAWNIADLAGRLVHKAPSSERRFRNSSWKATWVDGPITDVDLERGPENPLFRALVRWDLKMVVR